MFGKKGSKILKLPPVHNFFTLKMTNKLVVIINRLKYQIFEKILLYEMKFLVPNYSCLQNPWLWGYHPQIPVLSVLNWICWTPPPWKKIPGYATGVKGHRLSIEVRKPFTGNSPSNCVCLQYVQLWRRRPWSYLCAVNFRYLPLSLCTGQND